MSFNPFASTLGSTLQGSMLQHGYSFAPAAGAGAAGHTLQPGAPTVGAGSAAAGEGPGLPLGSAPLAGTTTLGAPSGGAENIRALIAMKERELHDINEYRLHSLEALLGEKVCEISAMYCSQLKHVAMRDCCSPLSPTLP